MKSKIIIALVPFLGILASCGGDSENDISISCDNSKLAIVISSTSDAACNQLGSIEALASGSTDITYQLDNGPLQTNGIFYVSAGTYTVTAVDKNDCSVSTVVTINAVGDAIVINDIVSTNAGCETANGEISVFASGGVATLMYSMDGGMSQSSNTFSNVASGNHTIEVSDGVCTSDRIEHVLSGISLVTDIMPLMEVKCAISGCHNGNNALPNLNIKSNVISNASEIKARVQSGDMPRNGVLSQQEKDIIACWVNDGGLDN